MTVISSIAGSGTELVRPSKKSYAGCDLSVVLEDVEVIRSKKHPFASEKRALIHEFSGIEPLKEFIVLTNRKTSLGRLTTSQIKEIFNDMGFNVNPTFGGKHFSDFDAVMNIGGYSIPGWVRLARLLAKAAPSQEKNLLRKLSPGRDRLHVRFFESNDGSWLIAAHTDHNWLSLNLKKVYKAHFTHGAGDYITGTIMTYLLLLGFAQKVRENQRFTEKNIQKILAVAYNRSLSTKIKLIRSGKKAVT